MKLRLHIVPVSPLVDKGNARSVSCVPLVATRISKLLTIATTRAGQGQNDTHKGSRLHEHGRS